MNYLFDIVQGSDLRIYLFLNRFAGNWFIDRFVAFQESIQVFRGGLILAAYWWLWFRGGADREKRRKAIIAIVSATLLAVVVCRILAAVTPPRLRPILNPNLGHPWSIPIETSFAQWTSFPSDTTTFFCALAFGLIVLLPRLRVPIVLYAAGWICFPRVYFGYHYPSDVAAGAVIGVAVVWALLRAEWLQSTFVPQVVAFADSRPHVFYAAAFLISFEMTTIFWDIRQLELKLAHAVRMLRHDASRTPSAATAADSLVAFTALLLVVGAAIVTQLIRRRERGRKQRRWPRCKIDVPVRVILIRPKVAIVPGRCTVLGGGGMAVLAGIEASPNEQVAVEFTPPRSGQPVSVRAFVRNRTLGEYGMEFITENDADYENVGQLEALLNTLQRIS